MAIQTCRAMYSFWLTLISTTLVPLLDCASCTDSSSQQHYIYLGADNLVAQRSIFPAVFYCTTGAEALLWLIVVPSAWPPPGTAKSDETTQTIFLAHHLNALQLVCALNLAKWPWWAKYQLSIIDYRDFLHIHLGAPLSSLININQNARVTRRSDF